MLDKPTKSLAQLPLEPQELKPRIIHDPNDGRPLIQNGGGEILDPFPPGSIEKRVLAQAGPPTRKSHSFDWDPNGPDAEAIVCRRQPATACYMNANGTIVLRQEAEWPEEDDTFAIITPDNAGAVTDAIMKLAREAK